MSKRGAQGPQGDKDSDLFSFNMSSTPDEKPQRATAAQLANRKIRDVRKRRPNSAAPPPSTSTSFGGAFGSLDPNSVSSAASPQPATNGFSFGQSQSFPGASSSPSSSVQPSQNGTSSPFSFGSGGGGGGGSTAFNFSSSSFGGPASSTPSNPFANMNSGAPSQPSGGEFSGFKGSMFNLPPTGSPAPAQQPLPSGGIFGASSQNNNTTGGIFGTPSTSAPSTNIFGTPAADKPSAFGQSTAFGESMQTSPDAKNTSTSSPASTSLSKPPPIFGGGSASQPSFGGSIFGSPAPASSSTNAETPKPLLFGAKPTEQPSTPSTPLFGASSAATPATTTATTAPPPSVFGASASAQPAAPASNPFANIFAGAPTPKAPEEKAEEKKPEESQSKSTSLFGSSTASGGASLFSKSETAAAPAAPAAPSSGLFQPPSTGNLFSPKPAAPAAAPAEQEKPKAPEGNPFSSLFVPKPATPSKPVEQKPLPSASPATTAPLSGLFSPKPSTSSEETKTASPQKPAAAPLFSAPAAASSSTPKAPSLFGSQPSPFSAPATTEPKAQAPAPTPAAAPSQSLFKVNGTTPTSSALSAPTSQSFEELQPTGLPADLGKDEKEDVETVHRVRMLNESFKRKIADLNPATDDFDAIIQFYMRVRETVGAPGSLKRKSRDEDAEAAAGGQSAKKVKPFGAVDANPRKEISSPAPASTASPTKTFGASQSTSESHKRKSDGDDTAPPEKRVNGDLSTADIFAQSFSKSKSDSDKEPAEAAAPPSFSPRPSTPDASKPSLFSTTPTTSPSKPLFPAPAKAAESSTSTPSLFGQSSISKPAFTAPTTSSTASAPSSSGNTPTFNIPKFGSGTSSGTTNFFSQFSAQADKEAAKEKAKRKAEDFDSDEDDEEEWERKDAEAQRKKQEEQQARASKRAKFVPGKGFVFEDEDSNGTEKKADEPAASDSGTSVFESKSNGTPAKTNNIFGHLSATPSEVEDNDNDADDTEEASNAGDDQDESSKDPNFVPVSESSSQYASETDSKAVSLSFADFSANESGEDGDITKSLRKSKQVITDKTTSEQPASESGAGSRSLFDRVELNEEGTPKRQGEEEKKSLSTFFNSSKYASSFNSPASSPNPFASLGKPQAEKSETTPPASKPATPNIFGSGNATGGGLFGLPSSSSSTSPSIFAQKPATDNTWKMNSPIKFASDSASKPDSASATPAAAPDASKPFSTLFGAAAPKLSSSAGSQPTTGFSFGGPSQSTPSSSFLAPPTLGSSAPSRSSTPGITSDTGAEESGDGDGVEKLPQVDLARGGAGEENEDVVIEARARGLKLTTGEKGSSWESQGVGFLRILKDRTTSRGRVLLRADPSGKVVLNASLMKAVKYTTSGNSVQFIVPQADGPPESWTLRVKKDDVDKLAKAMEETKN